jgi:3-hydroxyacyl-[acyl-carrier-protein] dehydratase/UDP-3-O-[3-hydroxymyristoyl] N-acetylglucosamine deacetylase/3-hydroxyacyl-[acyl-carrier-protein] dehydratase
MTTGFALDIEDILKFLPHRYPFLMIDRVLSIEPGKSVVALKNVTYNEEFFQGHFPLVRLMPGVLIIEAMAQAGGILIFHSIPDPYSKFMMFSKIDNMKFRRPVVPGDQLRLVVDFLKSKSRFYQIHGRAFVGDDLAVEGEMWASLHEREEFNAAR